MSTRTAKFVGLALVCMLWADADAQRPEDPQTPENVYFGDLHLHTRYSTDAFAFATWRTPDDAYLFAKGHGIPHVNGRLIQSNEPLDFLAVTDHAEFLGVFQWLAAGDSAEADHEAVRILRSDDATAKERAQAYMAFAGAARSGGPPEQFQQPEVERTVWQEIIDAADRHYLPGEFTTFAGYEWSASAGGGLHRNVIFADTRGLPFPFSARDSQNPEDLWTYLEQQRMRGIRVLAIPHNSNYSRGRMFELSTFDGGPLTAHYASRRMWNEPLVEIIQHKGTQETHPLLSPNDEFADFEILTPDLPEWLANDPENSRHENSGRYVREALLNGTRLQSEEGFDPFQFGFVGASDFHSGVSGVEEYDMDGFYGSAFASTAKLRRNQEREWDPLPLSLRSAAGLTAVWAPENTRDALFDSMRRRETYATSGTRIKVRFFGGWQYPADLIERGDWVPAAYAGGVPMGGVLSGSENDAPRFVVWAAKSPRGANLDRVQIVKGWSEDGETLERVYDVVLSDGRELRADGSAPAVGNTVDVATATYTNEIGDAELAIVWEDPEFDPLLPSFYYARVLEIPTPRWTTYDAVELGLEPPEEVPATIQERAFTSPIWYVPADPEG